MVDEFRGAPNRVNSVLKEQGNPIRIGGSTIAAQTSTEPVEKRKKDEPKPDADEKKPADKKAKK